MKITVTKTGIRRKIEEASGDRLSEDAIEAISEAAEAYIKLIASRSVEFAQHANRKTIKAADVKMALKNL